MRLFRKATKRWGKPSRPDFLLRSGELLTAFKSLHIVAYEEGFLTPPDRFVQRVVAIKLSAEASIVPEQARYRL